VTSSDFTRRFDKAPTAVMVAASLASPLRDHIEGREERGGGGGSRGEMSERLSLPDILMTFTSAIVSTYRKGGPLVALLVKFDCAQRA
jgi:hypothetical protein